MRNTYITLKKDLEANNGNYESSIFLFLFRYGSFFKEKMELGGLWYLIFPIKLIFHVLYKLLSTIFLMEIPLGTSVGAGLTIYHLKGIVVNGDAIIGNNVVLNHFVTLGEDVTIKDHAIINPLSVIVKGEIGNNAIVGAGSVVTKNVEDFNIVGGCPAKVIGSNLKETND